MADPNIEWDILWRNNLSMHRNTSAFPMKRGRMTMKISLGRGTQRLFSVKYMLGEAQIS